MPTPKPRSSFFTPLRYPGGKGKIAAFIKEVFEQNDLLDGVYAEPYAGGAGVALELLFHEYARKIVINDVSPHLAAFWRCVLNRTEELCRLIADNEVNIKAWRRQKAIHDHPDGHDELELAYATFFLNRTNRSGILTAGVIGGKNQDGYWKLDARFNAKDLIQRIEAIANERSRITFVQLDAIQFLREYAKAMPKKSLVYLDPPYYLKGKDLYTHFYEHDDHVKVAKAVPKFLKGKPWVVSYDDAAPIHDMYSDFRKIEYTLSYSAQERYQGGEVMFFNDDMQIPSLVAPMRKAA